MAPKIISAAILSMAVLTVYGFTETDVGTCSVTNGVPSFDIKYVCGLTFYTAYASGKNIESVTCQVTKYDCKNNGTFTHTIKTLINGIEQTVDVHTLKDLGNGLISRQIPLSNGRTKLLKEVVMGWGEKQENRFVLSTLICDETSTDDDHVMRMIETTHYDATLIDESRQMKRALPFPGLYAVPFACQKDSFFPPGSK